MKGKERDDLKTDRQTGLSRRDFVSSACAASLLASGCSLNVVSSGDGERRALGGLRPDCVGPAAEGTSVAVSHVPSRYEQGPLEKELARMLDGLGGLAGTVSRGDRVAIKVNLTGGTRYRGPRGLPAIETFATHPKVVAALAGLFLDAGAREVLVVEALSDWDTYRQWEYEALGRALGATLVDLSHPAPSSDFVVVPVLRGGLVYDELVVSPAIVDADVIVSVAKMKLHATCGVTGCLKNHMGLVPLDRYRLREGDGYRTAFHGTDPSAVGRRLDRIITDLNRTFPIDLAVIDGIMTTRGGEGPWVGPLVSLEPGLLVCSKNALAADAVASAIMGIDPCGPSLNGSLERPSNHLALAAAKGLGCHELSSMDLLGLGLTEAKEVYQAG